MKQISMNENQEEVFLIAQILEMKMNAILELYQSSLEAIPSLGNDSRCNDMFNKFTDLVMSLKDSAIHTIEQFDFMIALMDGHGDDK